MKTCQNCGMPAWHGSARCQACYQYRRRTGTERPERLTQPHIHHACTYCGWREKHLRRGLCHACAQKKSRQTLKLRRLINQINIKSTITDGKGLIPACPSARLMADSWQPGVANQGDIKLGRINAN